MAHVIIVGVDGSDTAATAAQAAARLAAGLGSALHVVTASASDDTVEIVVGSDRFLLSDIDKAETVAASAAARLSEPGLTVTSGAVKGSPADVLISEAERLDAEVIVVGNRRMQGPGRLLGSVANSVAHNAPCDVYIVKTT